MTAQLDGIIPQQNFELIRDQTGLVLGVELINQGTLDNTFEVPHIGIERNTPIDKTELPYINILLTKGQYISETRKLQHGSYTYALDVYTHGFADDDKTGDVAANQQLQRIIGMIRAILQNPAYTTLGFLPGNIAQGYAGIEQTEVTGFMIMDKPDTADTQNSVMGRVLFTVKAPEGSQLKAGYPFQIGNSTLQIGLTGKGYELVITDP